MTVQNFRMEAVCTIYVEISMPEVVTQLGELYKNVLRRDICLMHEAFYKTKNRESVDNTVCQGGISLVTYYRIHPEVQNKLIQSFIISF